MIDPPVSEGVLSREQASSRWRALGHRIRVVKLHSGRGQLVNVWGFDVFAAVTVDPFFSQIVDQNEHDVQLLRRCLGVGVRLAVNGGLRGDTNCEQADGEGRSVSKELAHRRLPY